MININPNIWGRVMWESLHYITLGYSENPTVEQKKEMYEFFMSLEKVLPCSTCRINFADHLKKYPLTNEVLASRYNLINWLIQIHNDVNIMLKKPTMTYDQVVDLYLNQKTNEQLLDKSSDSNNLIITIHNYFKQMNAKVISILIIIVLIVLLLSILKFKR